LLFVVCCLLFVVCCLLFVVCYKKAFQFLYLLVIIRILKKWNKKGWVSPFYLFFIV
jgi:hypothetical protein